MQAERQWLQKSAARRGSGAAYSLEERLEPLHQLLTVRLAELQGTRRSLLAGWLGTTFGMLPSLWVAIVGTLLGGAFVVLSPLTGMRELPRPDHADARAAD